MLWRIITLPLELFLSVVVHLCDRAQGWRRKA